MKRPDWVGGGFGGVARKEAEGGLPSGSGAAAGPPFAVTICWRTPPREASASHSTGGAGLGAGAPSNTIPSIPGTGRPRGAPGRGRGPAARVFKNSSTGRERDAHNPPP